MKAWRCEGDHFVATMRRQEASLLRGLVGQVHDMLLARADQASTDELAALTGMRSGPSTAPDDPILRRLLPDFHRLDAEGAGEPGDPAKDASRDADSAAALRSLHEPELVEQKSGVATVVLATCPERGGQIRLDDEQANAWLSALNDVRLALGTAIGVTEDMPETLPQDDPRAAHLSVYHWLSWVQESLVLALTS
ncbi:MAG: DUF2017 domain-containing protein [Sciscionella sp.]